MENEKEIRYFSMFTGVGGFELGFERANGDSEARRCGQEKNLSKQGSRDSCFESDKRQCSFTPVGFSEDDKHASQLLQEKFPNIKNYGNATKIDPRELPDFDLLCGGIPCQSFSLAGKRRGFEDTRGTMFFEVARILEVKRPSYVLIENVKGLLSNQKGETFRVILERLESLGYNLEWMVLNSKFFGVSQNRERVFIIGSLREKSRLQILPFGGSGEETNREDESERVKLIHNIYGGFGEKKIRQFKDYSPSIRTPKGGGHIPMVMNTLTEALGNRAGSSKEFLRSVNNISHATGKIRRLTPKECERLQGFPHLWTASFSDTQRYKMMGNAVTVNVIEAIGRKILQNFENDN